MDRIANFLFEVGMLKRTPRSGWQFLGTGSESVAEHVFRTALITYTLAKIDGAVDGDRALRLALFHDLPEARTGDLNYMNQKYSTADEERAAGDQVDGLPFAGELLDLFREYRDASTPEAVLVHDADQLELLMSLKEQLDNGNRQAEDWIPFLLRRLKTAAAKDLSREILEGHSTNWWFDRGSDWWVRGGKS